MKKRKNQLKDKSSTLFLLGLTCALALTLVSFEWRSFEERVYELAVYDDVDVSEPAVVYIIPEEPKPKIKQTLKTKESLDKLIVDDEIDLVDEKKKKSQVIEIDPNDILGFDNEDTTDVVEPLIELPVVPDFQAEFLGGKAARDKYLSTIHYPQTAIDVGIEGRVYLEFIVRKDGSIDNIKVIKGIGGGCDEEAVKTLTNSPLWKPGIKDGVAVDSYFKLPILFGFSE